MSGISIRYLLLSALALCCLSVIQADQVNGHEVEVNAAYGEQLQMQGRGGYSGNDKDDCRWGKWSKCSMHCGGGWKFRKCVKKGGNRPYADEEEFSDDELLSLLESPDVEEVAEEEIAALGSKGGKRDDKCDSKKHKWQKMKCNKHHCPGKWSKFSKCFGKHKHSCHGKKFAKCVPVKPRCFWNFNGALDFNAEAEVELAESELEALAASPESEFEGADEVAEAESFGGKKHRGCKVGKKKFEKCNACDGKWSRWSKDRCGKFAYKKCLSCHKKDGQSSFEAAESEDLNLSDAELDALDADGEILEEEAFDAADAAEPADAEAEALRHPKPCNECRPGSKIWVKKRCSPCQPPKHEDKKCKWGPWTKCKDCHKEKSWMYRKCKPHDDHKPRNDRYDSAVAAAEADGDADFTAEELSSFENDDSIEEVFDDEDGDELGAARSDRDREDDKKDHKDKHDCDCKKKHCVQKKKCDKKKHCEHKPEECKHKWGKWHKCSKKGWEYRKCKPHHDNERRDDRAFAAAEEEEADDFTEAELSAFDEDGDIEEVEDDDESAEIAASRRDRDDKDRKKDDKKDDKKKHDKKKCCDPKKCKIQKRKCKRHPPKHEDKDKKCKWGKWTKCKDCHKEKSWMFRKCKPHHDNDRHDRSDYDRSVAAAEEADGDADFTAEELSAFGDDASVEEVFEDDDDNEDGAAAARSDRDRKDDKKDDKKDRKRKDKHDCDCKKKRCVQKKKCDKKKHCEHKPEECKHKWGKWHKCSKKGWEYRKCKPHHDNDRRDDRSFAAAEDEEEADDFTEAELSAFDEDGEIEEVEDDDEDDFSAARRKDDDKKDDKKKDHKKKCCDPKKGKGVQKRKCKRDHDRDHDDKKKKCKCHCKCEKKDKKDDKKRWD